MKKITVIPAKAGIYIGIFITVFFLVVSAYAKPKQQPQYHQLTADDIVAKMKVQLELTDKQVDRVKPIIENYLAKEKQLKLEEKKQLSKVLTDQQLFTWNFLQNEPPREKKKKSAL
jgi:hypothetical protein